MNTPTGLPTRNRRAVKFVGALAAAGVLTMTGAAGLAHAVEPPPGAGDNPALIVPDLRLALTGGSDLAVPKCVGQFAPNQISFGQPQGGGHHYTVTVTFNMPTFTGTATYNADFGFNSWGFMLAGGGCKPKVTAPAPKPAPKPVAPPTPDAPIKVTPSFTG